MQHISHVTDDLAASFQSDGNQSSWKKDSRLSATKVAKMSTVLA